EDVIVGRGHPRRDVFALLFPPTTLYQLIRLPARGPKLTMGEEEQLAIKLLEPVNVARSTERPVTASVPIEQTRQSPPRVSTVSKPANFDCPKISGSRTTATAQARIMRTFQNATPYEVVVYANGTPLGPIAPCSESVILVPRGDLKLKAVAIV